MEFAAGSLVSARALQKCRASGAEEIAEKLFADDGDFGGGDFEAHEFAIWIKVEDDLEVGGGDFQAFVGFAVRADGARPIDGDGTRQKFLRNEHGEGLSAPAIPIIDAR